MLFSKSVAASLTLLALLSSSAIAQTQPVGPFAPAQEYRKPPAPLQFSAPYMLSAAGTSGAFPTIIIDSVGNRRFYYSVSTPNPEHLVVREQFLGSALGAEQTIMDTWGLNNLGNVARSAGAQFTNGNNLTRLALGKNTTASLITSVDNGGSYTFEKNYVNGTNGCSSYLPVFLSRDLTDTADPQRFIYGFLYNDGIFGCVYPHIYQAQQSCSGNCTWPATGTQLLAGATAAKGQIMGVYESGPLVNIITNGGVLRSTNNGASYTMLNNANTTQDNLKATGAAMGAANLYLVRSYSFGPAGSNQHLVFHDSSNFGANWSAPKPISVNAPNAFIEPTIAVSKHAASQAKILVVWKQSVGALTQQLQAATSYDGGATWLPIQNVVTLTGTNQISDVKLTYDAVAKSFLIAYGIVSNGTRVGVALVESN